MNMNGNVKDAKISQEGLMLFGREFEHLDGLRPMALAHLFLDGLVDDTGRLEEEARGMLGDALAERGLANEEEAEALYAVCLGLSVEYGDDWVRSGLIRYLADMRKDADSEVTADAMLKRATERYAPFPSDVERNLQLYSEIPQYVKDMWIWMTRLKYTAANLSRMVASLSITMDAHLRSIPEVARYENFEPTAKRYEGDSESHHKTIAYPA